ncbi:MAG: class I SAM-dependent methyltransferase [Alphaproteobacteria bacterium]|nr:class I SAM-dependent methyltransferase [Alphaproteobacteria bacterium]
MGVLEPHPTPLPRDYLARIAAIHRLLRPRTYLEIGVGHGRSLALAGPETLAVGVDPAPELLVDLPPRARVVRKTSDDFFAGHDMAEIFEGRSLDLVFIDGLHLVEFALHDIARAVRHCAPDARILVHDTLPWDRRIALRERETQAWTGDVWKVGFALRRHCPGLAMLTVDVAPSGLTILGRLDAATGLLDRCDAIVADVIDLDFEAFATEGRAALNVVPDDPDGVPAWIAATAGGDECAS